MKPNFLALVSIRNLLLAWPQFAAALWLTLTLSAAATSLQLNFTVPSSFNESNRQAVLEWNAAPARTYLVQSATNLSPETVWKTEEPVRASTNGPIRWMAPEALSAQKYYRLILPQPEVFSAEPAFVNSDDPAAVFYLIGQMLPTNGSVVINGLNFTPTLVDSNGGWLAISLNGLPPGTPVLGSILVLDNASNIVTTLPLQNPVIYGTELTVEQLQGPPEEPPASPAALGAAWLSKKGYDYYQAQSDMNAAGLHSNPYFQANQTAGDKPTTRGDYRGHVTVLKSHAGEDDEDDGFNSAFHKEFKGHVSLLKRGDTGGAALGKKHTKTGHVSLLKRGDSTSSARAGGSTGGAGAGIITTGLSSGELQSEETDLVIPGRGLDFAWTRTYRSRTETTTAQGAGWDFSYNVTATPQPDGTVVLRPGNGRADTFYPNGTNGWTRDEYFLVIRDVDQDGSPDAVVFSDGGQWTLHPPGTAFAGKLAQIVDPNGNAIRCDYDPNTGRLLQVVDTLDRTNTVAYTSKGLIESVTDFSGRTVRYEYDSAADLIACISPAVIGTPNGNDFPGGKTNRYAYSSGNLDERLNHNLVAVTDPKGQVCLEVTYQATNNPASLDFDAVSSVLRGIDKKDIRRGMVIARPSNSFATVQTIVNDYVGNVTEYLFDSRQRCVSVREFTGRADPAQPTTATENRPTGKLRAEDPDYFETRWEWNADSLCTLEIRPDGGSTEVSHQRAQDHNSSRSNKTASRAHDGDVRVVRERASSPVDMDGDGTPDTSDLAWYFEYDSRFGAPANNLRTRINELESRLQAIGLLSRTSGGNGGINETLPDTILHFARTAADSDKFAQVRGFKVEISGCGVSTIDPRGNSSTCDYDAQGNVRRITFKAKEGASLARILDFTYNAYGQLTAITNAADAAGYRRVDTFSYYTSGAQRGMLEVMVASALTGGLSLTTAFEYDPRGNVTRVVDPRGNDTVFNYNALDQLVAAETPANATYPYIQWDVSLSYDANDNLIRCEEGNRDSTGTPDATNPQWATLFEHDTRDRLIGLVQEISEGGGLPGRYATNRFFYDGNDNLVATHSPLAGAGVEPNNIAAFEYDERDLLHRAIRAPATAAAATNEFAYNGNGARVRALHRSSIDDVNQPKLTTLSYDGFNRPIGVTDAMGNFQQLNYDRNSNLIRARSYGELHDVIGSNSNVRLSETRYEYDSFNRLTRSVSSYFDRFTQTPLANGESATTVTYAPNGACTSLTDDNGHTTRYTYDNAGRLASVNDPKTNVVSFTYDACDNILSAIQADRSDLGGSPQFSVVYGYDRLHNLTRSVDNVGNTNLYAYDSRDNCVSHLNPRENETFRVFDGLGRCVAITNYVGKDRGITINTSHIEYDLNSRCIASTDGNGNATAYAYDERDRCVSVTKADGTHADLVWSPRSNLILHQDANGTVVSNSFDLLDRCVRRDITPGLNVAATTTFETFAYDGFSRCVAASNNVSLATFAFDSLGNTSRSTQDGLTNTCAYDSVGNRLAMTYPSGRTVSYTYDALDQVAGLSSSPGGLPASALATFEYDGPGRLSRFSRANNVNTRILWNGTANPANSVGDFGWQQVSTINHQVAGGGTVIDRRVAKYDRNQNKTARTQTAAFFPGGPTITNALQYDALDRMTSFARSSGAPEDYFKSHELDGPGNRLVTVFNGVPSPYTMDATPRPGPADFQMNQYTITPFVLAPEQYDENGNLVGRATAAGAELVFQYDYADRLVEVADGQTGVLQPIASYNYDALGRRIRKTIYPSGLPPVTTQFTYAGEDEDCDGDIIEERVNGVLTRTYVLPQVGDEVLVAFDQAGQPQFYHQDELGNTLALTDAAGAVIERCDYDDFGNPFFLSADGLPTGEAESGAGNPYCWLGLRLDAETGLYNDDGGGYFDPHTARGIGLPKITPKLAKESHGKFRVGNNPWSVGSPVEMKKGTVKFFNEAKGFGFVADGGVNVKLIVPIAMDKGLRFGVRGGSASGTRAQDHNSSRSNKTASIASPGGGGNGGGSKAQDHNSTRSNKTASIVVGGGDPGDLVVKFVVKK
jgi:YD repeat-containing protein